MTDMRGGTTQHRAELLANIQSAAAMLRALQAWCQTHADAHAVYRYYHQSFKAFDAQHVTVEIVQALRSLAPGSAELHPWFLDIVTAGTGHSFDIDTHNGDWTRLVGPILVAYQERVLADRVEVLGERHPATLSARANLAYSYWSVGRVPEATSLLRQAIDQADALDYTHPELASWQQALNSWLSDVD